MNPAQLHPDLRLGKVKLKVSDLRRSLEFYETAVGLRVLRVAGGSAELTADGENALVELREIPGAPITPRQSAAGLYHFALLLPTRKALGLQLRRLLELGVAVGHSDHDVSEALYLYDPDQNGIEIYRDRPRSEWQYEPNGQIVMGGRPLDEQGLLREAGDSPWNGMPAGTTMGHVHLHVSNLAESKRFYCDVLGLDVMMDGARFYGALFLSAGGYHHHLAVNIWAGPGAKTAPANGTGLEYYTIDLPDAAELSRAAARLTEAGVPLEEKSGAIFAVDPSGIQLKLMASKS